MKDKIGDLWVPFGRRLELTSGMLRVTFWEPEP